MARIENSFKKYLVSRMGRRWDVQSHEDQFSVGIPDLSYGVGGTNGWIELKRVRKWPRRPSTKVNISHLTAEQVNWLNKRGKKSGSCFVMIQVGTEYFVFPFYEARLLRTGVTEEEFRERSIQYWDGSINPGELVRVLTTKFPNKHSRP